MCLTKGSLYVGVVFVEKELVIRLQDPAGPGGHLSNAAWILDFVMLRVFSYVLL